MSMIARSLSKINEMINNVFEAKSFKSSNNTVTSLAEGAVVLNGTAGAIVIDDDGGKRLSWNDGGGNFQLRSGNYANGGEKFVGNNGAAAITLNSDAANGNILFKVADKGTDGAGIVWGHSLLLDNGGLKLNNNKIWHAGNDGSGSGLDADLLRGLPADFTSSQDTNGYQNLPGGLVMQWGSVAAASGGTSVTFPVAFVNSCINIQLTDNSTSNDGAVSFSDVSTSSFTAYNSQGHTTHWFSIGY